MSLDRADGKPILVQVMAWSCHSQATKVDPFLCHHMISLGHNELHACKFLSQAACIPNTVRCHYNAVNFLTNIHERQSIARPLGRAMGVSFVDPACDWYSSPVPVIIHAISYNIGLHYNGSGLYETIPKIGAIIPSSLHGVICLIRKYMKIMIQISEYSKNLDS